MPFEGENERSMVMLDNASIHHIDLVVEAIKCWSISQVLTTLPYAPRRSICRSEGIHKTQLHAVFTSRAPSYYFIMHSHSCRLIIVFHTYTMLAMCNAFASHHCMGVYYSYCSVLFIIITTKER